MGLLTLKEDRPTPPCVYNYRVYCCATVAAFCAVMIGYDSAFIGGTLALNSFKKEFDWSQYSTSEANLINENIVSLYQAGAFFGSFFAYAVGHYLGRRRGLQIFSGVFILGAGLMLGANGDRGLGLIYGGRVLAGIGVGGASNLTPIYISELAPPAIRGRLVGLYEMGWQLGGVVGFWINYGVSTTMPENHSQWIIPFAVQLIPAGLMFIGLFFIKESPRWLMTRGKRDLALKNLCWIRKLDTDDMYMLEEVAAIDAGLEYQQSTVGLGFWQPFKSLWNDRKVMYRFFLGCSLFFWQNASGINAINYYSPTVFRSIGLTGTNTSLLTTGIFGVIKAVVTLIWLFFLIDNLGRRNLLMIGALGGSICLFYVGGYIAVAKPEENPSSTISSGGISAMAFFYLWTIFYTPSWNGTPWVINSEMFPQNVRTLGQAFAAASNWFFNFLVARFTQQMFTGMGYGVYFFFASLMLCSIVFVWFLIPETKGIPLESMDRLFSKDLPQRRAHKIVMAELAEDEESFRRNVEGSGLGLEKDEFGEKKAHVEVV
ncbi:MFS general substrate transporter [Glarea lozoyensis ATCC 20868]|uniref:Quinate transporter n=1 Tax=Glarea lozoyensis (strain ATCC 20868 / MF5171) TaxID=1116229 RepID=S3CYP8_GLAL2|nr:MFS general substrate transporter [Glarea lozoyensis ATCC 20868]EPE24951.1 MFS general substrate transporter [Glarea lozoyensis ATCC 20868]